MNPTALEQKRAQQTSHTHRGMKRNHTDLGVLQGVHTQTQLAKSTSAHVTWKERSNITFFPEDETEA